MAKYSLRLPPSAKRLKVTCGCGEVFRVVVEGGDSFPKVTCPGCGESADFAAGLEEGAAQVVRWRADG